MMPLPCTRNSPVHAGALQDGLRVSMPWPETKKLQSDDWHVKTCVCMYVCMYLCESALSFETKKLQSDDWHAKTCVCMYVSLAAV